MSTVMIGDVIREILAQHGKQQLFLEQQAVEIWPDVVGNLISRYTHKVSVSKGVLTVFVKNSALRFELNGRKSEIIEKLNDKLGAPTIKDLNIR
ncbi:MAG TPA: DUF721 domain-containing protein [Bacteroidales bacterium]|nr:DUF721 domain-containing protein [Bacteroidales bacterium]HOH22955.1 DUF721 domain-containing protein [Bacteroidales bacterium]HPB58119.1 DUF721 domain-containing protein [Bacteroidales bacterium]HPZ02655.1 DUF721 domain-containing protein [Bacteroidales bacterium]HQB74446.1 DUF721 domain-containing protein [Bacteroidales bacterium]